MALWTRQCLFYRLSQGPPLRQQHLPHSSSAGCGFLMAVCYVMGALTDWILPHQQLVTDRGLTGQRPRLEQLAPADSHCQQTLLVLMNPTVV
jgi:hypothetical protein